MLSSILVLASAGCGDAPDVSYQTDELTPGRRYPNPLFIPDRDGDIHVLETKSLTIGPSHLLWVATIDKIPYEVLAEGDAENLRVVVSRDRQPVFSMLLDPIFETLESFTAEGSLSVTYPAAALPAKADLLGSDEFPVLGLFDNATEAGGDGMAISMVLFGLPHLLSAVIGEGESETMASAFLGGLFGLLKKVGEFLGNLFGGGGGGGGVDCSGGSSASCTNSAGQRSSVSCGDCSARCVEIFGVAGTTCDCGCGI